MTWLLPPLPPTFEAALRDVRARRAEARIAAAERLGTPDSGRDDEALQGLATLGDDRDARVRAAAVRALQQLDPARALPALVARLEDGDALVRELAVIALEAAGSADACAALRSALRSPHPEVRFQAVVSYVEACEQPQLSALKPLLRDEDDKVRANAARAVAHFGAEAHAELSRAVEDPNRTVRAEAALALARLGQTPDADALRCAFDDPTLLTEALDAVAALELQALREDAAAVAQSVLKPLATKVAAARALIRLGDPRGPAALRGVLRAFRSDGRSAAVQVVAELRLRELLPELLRLSRRLRGTDPELLVAALAAILPDEPSARAGLQRLAQRHDAAGDRARAALAAPGLQP